MTHVSAKVKFSYPLNESRFVSMDDNKDVTIGDLNTIAKRALLNAPCWVKLVEEMEEIDKVVERAAMLKLTKYKFHVGDNWFISISDELPFVDIRRWYQRGDGIYLFPTLVGIALTFIQWNQLKEVAKLEDMKKEFEDAEPC